MKKVLERSEKKENDEIYSIYTFKKDIIRNWEHLKNLILRNDDKQKVIEVLDLLNFKDSYIVGYISEKLTKGSTKVILSKSNLAYILSRHLYDFSDSTILEKINEIIDTGDVFKGRLSYNDDYIFFKYYKSPVNGPFAIELKMNRKNMYSDEYVVHYLQVKGRKADKMLA